MKVSERKSQRGWKHLCCTENNGEELERRDNCRNCKHRHLAVRGCTAAATAQAQRTTNVFKDDPVNETTAKIREADGFIMLSTYYAGIAGTMKSSTGSSIH